MRPLFAAEKRETPVDLRYPSVTQDDVTLKLPAGLAIESVPKNVNIPMSDLALYQARYGGKGADFEEIRKVTVGSPLYKTEEYSQLREFFQKANAQDQEQVILKRAAE